MFHIYYIIDGVVSPEPDDCQTPVEVALSLELAFFGGNPDEGAQGWLLEVQTMCEQALESKESEQTVLEDDDFILKYEP